LDWFYQANRAPLLKILAFFLSWQILGKPILVIGLPKVKVRLFTPKFTWVLLSWPGFKGDVSFFPLPWWKNSRILHWEIHEITWGSKIFPFLESFLGGLIFPIAWGTPAFSGRLAL